VQFRLDILSHTLLPNFQLTNKKSRGTRVQNMSFITVLTMCTRSHFHGSRAKPQLSEELAHVLHLLSASSVEIVHLRSEATSSTARSESTCTRKAISPWLRLGSVGLHPRVCSVTAWAAVGRVGADRVWRRREGSRGVDKRWWRECSSKA